MSEAATTYITIVNNPETPERPWIPEVTTNLPLTVEQLDYATVRVARHLKVEGSDECETVIEFAGMNAQTYNTTAADIAAAFRRLADRIEQAHES